MLSNPNKTCPACGAVFAASFRVCPRCGAQADAAPVYTAQAPVPPVCPRCGAVLEPGTTICPSCRMKLETPAPSYEAASAVYETAGSAYRPAAAGPAVCPRCGAAVTPGAAICPSCRVKLDASAPVPPAPVPPAPVPPAPVPPAPEAPGFVPDREQDPLTIEELEVWYQAHGLPPEDVTRFFIGKDIREPRAFGIFRRPNGTVVVYKNKMGGERAVRYQGPDEAFAVHEFLERLRQEIAEQKRNNAVRGSSAVRQPVTRQPMSKKSKIILCVVLAAIIGMILWIEMCSMDSGYYYYDDHYYYYSHDSWYWYNNGAWGACMMVPDVEWDDYYYGDDYNSTWGTGSFESSDYYYDYVKENWDRQDEQDSWDSSDSWDSGSTDWDSDW